MANASDPSQNPAHEHYYVDPNWPDPNGPNDAPIIIYGYVPSLAVALLGIILFAISFLIHTWQIRRYRTWYFIPVLVGTIMEIVGYINRTLSAKVDPYNIIFFVLQYFFIVVAPVFFSASIYTILSVLINRLPRGRQLSPLPPKVILGLFITCDIIATVIQVTGAALIGSAESTRKDPRPANHILLAGLAFQVFTFLIFIILLHIFLFRARKYINCNTVSRIKTLRAENASSNVNSDAEEALNETIGALGWDFIWAFNIATLAIYLRTCFRLAETAQGLQEFLMTHEVFFGCLEFAPVVIAVFLFNGWHPGRCLPPPAE